MQIIINNNPVEVIIERKRIKNMYMRVKDDLNIHVTANIFVSENDIINTINKNKNAILKMYNMARKKKNSDSMYKMLGEEYQVIFDDTLKKIVIDGNRIFTKDDKMLDKYYLIESKRIMTNEFNRLYECFENAPECRLRFRKMTTRWGVNNVRDKIITLNTELFKYDVSLIDYVIIHELCHFKEANHSNRFWMEVSKYYPNYKMARKLLKE